MLPKLYDGHNKTFFMGSYEGVRGTPFSTPFNNVPTALMRQGNFSEITTAIKNPLTGQLYPGNIIPPATAVSHRAEAARLLSGAEPDGEHAGCEQPPESEPNDDKSISS